MADVLLGAVVPRTPRHLLADPRAAKRLRHEAATGGAVVVPAWIPVAVSAGLGAGVHERPGVERRRVAELEVVGRTRREVETVVEHAPAPELRHVAQQIRQTAAVVAAQLVVSGLEPAAVGDVQPKLEAHGSVRAAGGA